MSLTNALSSRLFSRLFSHSVLSAMLLTLVTGQLLPACAQQTTAPAATVPTTASTTAPDSDIFVAKLDLRAGSITQARNITHRPGYDNQPSFVNDGSAILYVSDQSGSINVVRHTLASGVTKAITATPENLYSPIMLADGSGFSAVRVSTPNANGAESKAPPIWRFDWEGKPVAPLTEVRVVGYYAIINDHQMALFVVDDDAQRNAHKLVLSDSRNARSTLLTTHPGRSLARTPDGLRATFVDKSNPSRWVIAAMGAQDAQPTVLVPTVTVTGPADEKEADRSEDFCWLPDGSILMAHGTRFFRWNGQANSGFEVYADMGKLGGQIKRLAVSRDGTQLAFVVQLDATKP